MRLNPEVAQSQVRIYDTDLGSKRQYRVLEIEEFSTYFNQDYQKLIHGETTVEQLRNIYFGFRYRENITAIQIEQNSLERNNDPRTFGSVYQEVNLRDFSNCGKIFKNRIRDMEQSMVQSMVQSQAQLSSREEQPLNINNQSYAGSRINNWIQRSMDFTNTTQKQSEEEFKLKAAYPFIAELDDFVKKTHAQRVFVRKELKKSLALLTTMSLDNDASANEASTIGKKLESIEQTVSSNLISGRKFDWQTRQ